MRFTFDDDPSRLWPHLGQSAALLADTCRAGGREPGEGGLSRRNARIVMGQRENGDGPKVRTMLVGCCRAVADLARFSAPSDVSIAAPRRGRGFGSSMSATMPDHPDLDRGRWRLDTRDAHAPYRRFGVVGIGPTTRERRPAALAAARPRREGLA